jgi:hypothetical protein
MSRIGPIHGRGPVPYHTPDMLVPFDAVRPEDYHPPWPPARANRLGIPSRVSVG